MSSRTASRALVPIPDSTVRSTRELDFARQDDIGLTSNSGSSCSGDSMFFSFPYYNFNNDGIDFGSLPAKVNANTKSFECVRSGLTPPGVTGAGTGIFYANTH